MHRKVRAGIRALAWLALGVVIIGWIVMAALGDRFWWTVPVLFGPRWVWLIAALFTLPWAFVSRRGTPIAIAALAIAVFGIVDFRLGLARLTASSGVAVRVMTLNAGAGSSVPQSPRILAEIRRVDADVVILTECGGHLPAALEELAGVYTIKAARMTSNCLLTKGTITGWWERDPSDAFRQYGSGAIQRVEVSLPQGNVRLGMVHLSTPRQALEEFRDISTIPSLGPITRRNMDEREEESEHAVEWIDQGPPMPLIIAGDFNLPIESAIYRRNWSRFRNAFSEVGWGPGYTKHTSWWGIRIDHILSNSDVHPQRSRVGRDVGSDHLPLVADLIIPAQIERGRVNVDSGTAEIRR